MATGFSTSDYVAITLGLVQIVVTTALAVWTVRKTTPQERKATSTSPNNTMRSVLRAWLKSSWLFVLFFIIGMSALAAHVVSDEQLTKHYVLWLVFLMFYTFTNLLLAISSLFFDLQMTINEGLLKTTQGLLKTTQGLLKTTKGTNKINAGLLGIMDQMNASIAGTEKSKHEEGGE